MGVGLYLDVHVPQAIARQLRIRGVDVLTAQEDDATEWPDVRLLERRHTLGRIIFTQDIRFKLCAEQCQQDEQPFSGLVFGHQLRGTIGQYVRDLELIAKATELHDWHNVVAVIPL